MCGGGDTSAPQWRRVWSAVRRRPAEEGLTGHGERLALFYGRWELLEAFKHGSDAVHFVSTKDHSVK